MDDSETGITATAGAHEQSAMTIGSVPIHTHFLSPLLDMSIVVGRLHGWRRKVRVGTAAASNVWSSYREQTVEGWDWVVFVCAYTPFPPSISP
jgi:hypothetical protein